MMDALVSGSAARAVFIQGSLVQFMDAESPDELHTSTLSAIPRLLEGACDIVRMKVKRHTDCFDILLRGYNCDRATRMLQIVLMNDDLEDTTEAVTILETLLEQEGVADHVLNLTYAVPYPDFPEIPRDVFGSASKVYKLYADLLRHQDAISAVRGEFDRLKFVSSEIKSGYEKSALHAGIFKLVTYLSLGEVSASDVSFACIRAFAHLPDSRAISTRWVGAFTKERVGRKMRKLDDLELDTEGYEGDLEDEGFGDGPVAFQAVNAQIQGILGRLDNREVEVARRFADQLIQSQLQATRSGRYAVKSLCNLATEARHRGLHDLELEWAERAKEVSPQDGWARALLGDTYLLLYRLSDAEEEFRAAAAVGEGVYGKIGLARVAKQSGNLDRALDLFIEARAEAKDRGYAIAAWIGYCATLRDMWKPEETMAAFAEAKAAFPDEIDFQTGYARSLEYLGHLEDAKTAFVTAKINWPGDPKGFCGEADIYKHSGEFEIARGLYEHAVKIFPTSIEAIIGLADLHRKSGDLHEALKLYLEAQEKFPYAPQAFTGAGDTQLDARDYAEALRTYEIAAKNFGLDVGVRNGRANAHKRAGQFARSLQLYDENVHDFPYSLPALNGRAGLLKLLGKYDEALQAYDAILVRQPRYVSAKAAKASALIAQGRFEEADDLLAHKGLRTRNEWLTYHVRGLWYLKRGDLPSARAIFSEGEARAPFHLLRKQFQASLACCELQSDTYEGIPEYLKGSSEPIHVLLRTISLAFAGRFENAASEVGSAAAPMTPRLQEIRERLDHVIVERKANEGDRVWLVRASEEAVLQLVA
jgi:tetratricopeptide (TPR) repeat protein